MTNKAKIKGNKNYVFQGNKDSSFNLNNENHNLDTKPKYGLIGIIVAILGLIATIIIGWDSIIKFFTK